MSYRCAACGKHGEGAPKRVVRVSREATYPERTYTTKGREVYDRGGHGTEIVREANIHPECA